MYFCISTTPRVGNKVPRGEIPHRGKGNILTSPAHHPSYGWTRSVSKRSGERGRGGEDKNTHACDSLAPDAGSSDTTKRKGSNRGCIRNRRSVKLRRMDGRQHGVRVTYPCSFLNPNVNTLDLRDERKY